MRVKLGKNISKFLERNGTQVFTPPDNEYYCIPFLYKKTEIPGVYEEIPFEKVPDDLKQVLGFLKEK